ncbi:Hypothetical protein, putative [Bodo saltans]|uniref:Uncharacterized protein n=1 Tax=Bodo saltans TaxID=75058 RepID=A0A0S4IQ86_BODSA|nr:Hypothetical protein, putative [Bodo saltans]|eukprot:CUF17556.1 Hypothetical protein, putative [Bodo saltans]
MRVNGMSTQKDPYTLPRPLHTAAYILDILARQLCCTSLKETDLIGAAFSKPRPKNQVMQFGLRFFTFAFVHSSISRKEWLETQLSIL